MFLDTRHRHHRVAVKRQSVAYYLPGALEFQHFDIEAYHQTGVLAGIRVFTPEKARMSTRDVDRMLLEGYVGTKH
jgi:hypothetical protein